MIRVERLVVPEAKSRRSTSSVRRPARAHSRAIATPLIPPPMTATSKDRLSSGGRWAEFLTCDVGCACGGPEFQTPGKASLLAGSGGFLLVVLVLVLLLETAQKRGGVDAENAR